MTAHAPPGTAGRRSLLVAFVTTAVVTILSYAVPEEHSATAVGLGFLVATYFLALRTEDPDAARRHGLSLGGLLDPEPIDLGRLLRSAAGELGFALLLGAIVFPAFWLGYLLWWSPRQPFRPAPVGFVAHEALGQFLVIALPEEAFFRGYLQTRLDEAWPPRRFVLGVPVGLGVLVTSAIFALGHLATEPNLGRLAVFFPSLLFGWIRNKRGSAGSSAAFHALCNTFASYLGRGYGFLA